MDKRWNWLISRMRNRVIGRLFREIKLIEQLGI